MVEIAFIIPIHPKDYHYIYKLSNKIENINLISDIYLVFSSQEDYDKFEDKPNYKYMIIDEVKTDNIITYKKFFGLNKLKSKIEYNYFIVCDSEIDIIVENFTLNNVLKKITNIFENKLIYAGEPRYNHLKKVTEKSSTIFKKKSDVIKLKKVTNNFNLFYWWSDLPVYKRIHLYDFFNKIDSKLNFFHFDHKIYLNYLILYHRFNLLNITPNLHCNWSLENYHTTKLKYLKKLKKRNYGFSWIGYKLFNIHKNFLRSEGSFLLYHIDR